MREAWPLIVLHVLISETTDCRKALRTCRAVNPPGMARDSRTRTIASSASRRFPSSHVNTTQKRPLEPGFQLDASIMWTSLLFSRISCQSTELSPPPSTNARMSSTGAAGSVRPGIGHARATRVISTFSKKRTRRGPSWRGSAGTRTGASPGLGAPPKRASTPARARAAPTPPPPPPAEVAPPAAAAWRLPHAAPDHDALYVRQVALGVIRHGAPRVGRRKDVL